MYDSGEYQKQTNGSIYTRQISDGLRLLRAHCTSSDRVLTMEMQNPFPWALGWPPPRGGIASIAFNFTISAKYRPSFDVFFGDATAVMAPKHHATPDDLIDGFHAIFLPAVRQRFRAKAESTEWILYTKN
jgi:hypothetical protein